MKRYLQYVKIIDCYIGNINYYDICLVYGPECWHLVFVVIYLIRIPHANQ